MISVMSDESALVLAREAAAAGAAVILEAEVHIRGARPRIERKGSPIDLVTEVDRASERAIVAVLARSGIAIIAEEGARIEGSTEIGSAVWYVDPLDGTTSFAHGHPFHCVSIGLVRDGAPIIGVVHAPMLGVVFSGGPRLGATRRDLVRGIERALAVSHTKALDEALLTTGFPYDRRTSDDDNLAAHGAMTKLTQGVYRCGSAALDLSLVADGTYDGYWERKLKPWDVAAGMALVVAAGGVVTDPSGGEANMDDGRLLATNGFLHDALRQSLAPFMPPRVLRP
ncbi:MAG: inositol monophosphatase family protein [Polyangiales bacterium]